MAVTFQTKEVLPMLAERGLHVHRELLAEMSDLLGLQARTTKANWSHRRWYAPEIELIALAFQLRREWGFPLDVIQSLVTEKGYAPHLIESLRGSLDTFVSTADEVLSNQEALRRQAEEMPAAETKRGPRTQRKDAA